ncbi:amino acid adenylation domain-containing protein [Streptomyces sp. 71268]|uniref:non-ribosomal peptide synthetase n=1 Tax=Streptomyces sp. 71268 TaxID=3002640 RepID=UPI0023F8AF15|nr:amino acid adenylation domain-containing protein [Streptomyces sp. 71268]WEV29237.1 amino acid adenylation domain-containing protein [Streptomyces sp. 71268]
MTCPSTSPPGTPAPRPAERDHAGATAPLPALLRPLWLASRVAADSALYNEPAAFVLRGPLDTGALRRALDAVYERHAALRTVVVGDDHDPRIAVLAPHPFPLEERDLRAHGPGSARHLAEEWAATAARRPFDLERGPLARAGLLRCADQEWVLVVVLHHLVCDGYSLGLFFAEIGEAYARDAAPPTVVAAHCAQQELASSVSPEQLAADRAYWERRLAGVPARMPLPTDRPEPATPRRTGHRVPIPLPPDWFASARAAAAELRTPPFALALAALARVVGALADAEDVVIGTTVNVRAEAEAEEAVGYFLKTIPLRLRVPPGRTVADAVRHAHDVVLAAISHTGCEFDDILAAAEARGGGRPALLQVALELQYEPAELTLAGASATRLAVHTGTAKSELTFHLSAAPGTPSELEYATELYDERTATSLAAAFATVVAGVRAGAALDALVWDELPLTDGEARREVTALAEGEPLKPPRWALLPEAVRERALLHPERPAVVAAPGSGAPTVLTYAELDARAGALGRRLRAAGVGRGTAVGILAARPERRIAAVFGAWRVGAVCVALDPDLPALRLRHLVEAAEVRVLVLEEEQDDAFAPPGVRRLRWTEPPRPDAMADAGPESVDATPDDTAYIIFTSGSSGQPKAVAVRHGSLAAFGQAMRQLAFADLENVSREEADGTGARADGEPLRVAQNASPSFDASWQSTLLLGSGHTLYPVPSALRSDGEAFVAFLRAHRVDLLDATPTHAQHLVRAGLLAPGKPAPRLLVLGGEAVPQGLWDRLASGPVRAVNVYGPTEFTVNATGCPIGPAHPRPVIGRPLAGVTAQVMDRHRRPVPRGFPGELYLSGPQLAVGYHGRPDLTGERFVTLPDGRRAYATGDLARWRADGTLEFLGRRDGQIKLRGHRIELDEVAETLRGAPLVADAAATVVDTSTERPVLVGCLVPAGPGLAPEAVRAYAAARLPAYMVPAACHVVDALPRTAAGKLDRPALHALIAARREAGGPTADAGSTAGPADGPLAALWCRLLRRESVCHDDDFFALGGHSLLATQLAREARATLGVRLPLRVIFEHRTLAAMEAALAGTAPEATPDAAPGPDSGPGATAAPRPDGRQTTPAGRTRTPGRGLVVPLAPTGPAGSAPDTVPLVLVHPLGGTLHAYEPLLRLLPRTLPVWGVRSPAMSGAGAEPDTVDDLARRYAAALVERPGVGALALFGWSLGGLAALAVADALERRGVEVTAVELWDCGIGGREPEGDRESLRLALNATYGAVDTPALRRVLDVVPEGATADEAALRRAWDLAGPLGEADRNALEHNFRTIRHQSDLFRGWRPSFRLRAPVHAVYARETIRTDTVADTDWALWTRGGWSTDTVETDHYGMMRPPHVALAARRLLSRPHIGRTP